MLNSLEIERGLELQGFARVPGKNARIHEFARRDYILYVKTPGENSVSGVVAKEPLIIHPRHESNRETLSAISGVKVDWESRRKNSNLTAFQEARGTKIGESPWGFPVAVESLGALKRLLAALTGNREPELANPLDEIKGASNLPMDTTQRKALIDARIGQGQFRRDLMDYWGQCAVTGLDEPLLLRASHIKPWAKSENRERLDPSNGLLLSANLDAAFDAGLISFENDGRILISDVFAQHAAAGIETDMRLRKITTTHAAYLVWHRDNVFQGRT